MNHDPPQPDAARLILAPLAGPHLSPVEIDADATILGRGSAADRRLPDPAVSRAHCRLTHATTGWAIEDLKSRHGTIVNGEILRANHPRTIHPGDRLEIGPWLFEVRLPGQPGQAMISRWQPHAPPTSASRVALRDDEPGSTIIAPVRRTSGDLSAARLEALVRYARDLHAASDPRALAQRIVDAASEGTGFPWAGLLEETEQQDQLESLAWTTPDSAAPPPVSRSMIAAARRGETVRLTEEPTLQHAQSIVSAEVRYAMCVPIRIDEHEGAEQPATRRYLYLAETSGGVRARLGSTPWDDPDAAEFCAAIAEIAALAFNNLEQREREVQRRLLLAELDAAQTVQRRLLPQPVGRVRAFSYALHFQPGRQVAGDLFAALDLDDNRSAFFLGDVVGKGVGPALLMSMAQSCLASTLLAGIDPTTALTRTNDYVCQHSADAEFLTLILAVVDRTNNTVQICDAGHGYAVLVREGQPQTVTTAGGLPVGVMPEQIYESSTIHAQPNDRIIVFTDGVVEQADAQREQFGLQRTLDLLAASDNSRTDVESIAHAVTQYAASDQLDDDLTIASVTLG